jgi:hypothetical protein
LAQPLLRFREIRFGRVEEIAHVAPIRPLLRCHVADEHLAADQRVSEGEQRNFDARLVELRRNGCGAVRRLS